MTIMEIERGEGMVMETETGEGMVMETEIGEGMVNETEIGEGMVMETERSVGRNNGIAKSEGALVESSIEGSNWIKEGFTVTRMGI